MSYFRGSKCTKWLAASIYVILDYKIRRCKMRGPKVHLMTTDRTRDCSEVKNLFESSFFSSLFDEARRLSFFFIPPKLQVRRRERVHHAGRQKITPRHNSFFDMQRQGRYWRARKQESGSSTAVKSINFELSPRCCREINPSPLSPLPILVTTHGDYDDDECGFFFECNKQIRI